MAEKWIQKAIKHPGALTKAAKKAHAISKKTGKIKASWEDEEAKKSGKVGARARLAKTLKKMHKK